jgi:hypothetical protein
MNRLYTAALLLLLAPAPFLRADEASKRAKVEELIQITKVNQIAEQMTQQMTTRMRTMAAQQTASHTVSPAQQKAISDYITQLETITRNAVAWDKIKAGIVADYSQAYTEPELDGILAFYHSPAGKALLEKSPELMSKTMQTVQNQMAAAQPQMREANAEFTRKMKELAPAPAPASTTPAPASKPAPAAKH